MRSGLYLPLDVLVGEQRDSDAAADFLELAAFFAEDGFARTSDVANEASIGAEEEPSDLDDEMRHGVEELVSEVVQRIESRSDALGSEYPFRLRRRGKILSYEPAGDSIGQGAYVLSLVLSNLQSVLDQSRLRPEEDDIPKLRQWFQYLGTAALAAEIQGIAWSFGFPRPDRSGFLKKLREIWSNFNDGIVDQTPGTSESPKDDKVDVFAARLYRDRQPGFLFAAAQVATGQRWREKSLLGHLEPFKKDWFADIPRTHLIPYMIVPFAVDDLKFRVDVGRLGNMLHRLRVPLRVSEARKLVDAGVKIEAYDRLHEVVDWVASYRDRAMEAA